MPEASKSRRAVVLLSGGLDSVTVLAIARAEGYAVHALSFRYGQRHVFELESAARTAMAASATEEITSCLTDAFASRFEDLAEGLLET